jgi:hypothetical protein
LNRSCVDHDAYIDTINRSAACESLEATAEAEAS